MIIFLLFTILFVLSGYSFKWIKNKLKKIEKRNITVNKQTIMIDNKTPDKEIIEIKNLSHE